ncbi:MAG TPA: chemotaxis protein CheW [Candidatus Binatia bacterium]
MSLPGSPTPAMQPPTGTAAAPRSDYCIFLRDGRRFALSTLIAKEVLEARPFTPVPYAPPELLGAFNLRGEVVPLVNLDGFLGVEGRPAGRGDTLLLLSHGDLVLAAVVDQVVVIKHVAPWEIRRSKLDPAMRNPLVRGIVGRDGEQTLVLDGEKLLAAVVGQIADGLRGRGKTPSGPSVLSAPGGSARTQGTAQNDGGTDARLGVRAGGEEAEARDAQDASAAPPTLTAGGGST